MEGFIIRANVRNIALTRVSLLLQKKNYRSFYDTGKGSGPLEMQAFKNCLFDLEENAFPVDTIATDRNKQVAKWIRLERPSIKHKYDPWHFVIKN